MIKANVFEVKARLSEYIDRVATGEHVVICRHNTPVAELRAIIQARLEPRPVGRLAGRPSFDLPASFFEPLPDEELDAWEGIGGSDVSSPYAPTHRRPSRAAEPKTTYKGTRSIGPARKARRTRGRKP